MATIIFETYAYIKKLHAETFAGIINEQPAAKKDLAELEAPLKRDIAALPACLKRDIPELEQSMDMRFKEVEYKLTIRPGAMMAASVAMVAALVKLL